MGFAEHVDSMGVLEEHPKWPEWVAQALDQLENWVYEGYERHGDCVSAGAEGLIYQCRRKVGDLSHYILDNFDAAMEGMGRPESDSVLEVSKDAVTFNFLLYLYIWVNQHLKEHPEDADVAGEIRQQREWEILRKYDECLKGNHNLTLVAETVGEEPIAQECSVCGLQLEAIGL